MRAACGLFRATTLHTLIIVPSKIVSLPPPQINLQRQRRMRCFSTINSGAGSAPPAHETLGSGAPMCFLISTKGPMIRRAKTFFVSPPRVRKNPAKSALIQLLPRSAKRTCKEDSGRLVQSWKRDPWPFPARGRHGRPRMDANGGTPLKLVLTGVSASVAESVTFPIDATKTRLQLQGEEVCRAAKKFCPLRVCGFVLSLVYPTHACV